MKIGIYLKNIDNVCDYVPLVSTVTNLVDLFQKTVVLPFLERSYIQSNHYFTHLNKKSFYRCVILLLPIIGNILIGIYDFKNMNYNNRDFMLAAVAQDGWALRDASAELRNNQEVVLDEVTTRLLYLP